MRKHRSVIAITYFRVEKVDCKSHFFAISYYLLPCFLLPCFLLPCFLLPSVLLPITELTISGKIIIRNYLSIDVLVLHLNMKFEVVTVCIITFTLYFQRVRCLPPNPLATEYNLGKYKYLSINFTLYIWKHVSIGCRLLNKNYKENNYKENEVMILCVLVLCLLNLGIFHRHT